MSQTIDTPGGDARGTYQFFALACGVTWLLATPAALAWAHRVAPPPDAVACAGLSAFGPTLAALIVAAPRRELGEVFGRWRANPLWIVVALLATPAIHLLATALYAALGGHPTSWFHPPATPESFAALVVFPLGEELGWRGFAHPRMALRFGLVKGSLITGSVWGLWHLAYSITPAAGTFDVTQFVLGLIELPLYSLLIAWIFELTHRSMAVAVAFHAGAHLDHFEQAPGTDLRLHALHLLVLGVLALLAARALSSRRGLPAVQGVQGSLNS